MSGMCVCGLLSQKHQQTGPDLNLSCVFPLEGHGATVEAGTGQPGLSGERRLETINHFMLIYFMILTGWGLHKTDNMWIR